MVEMMELEMVEMKLEMVEMELEMVEVELVEMVENHEKGYSVLLA